MIQRRHNRLRIITNATTNVLAINVFLAHLLIHVKIAGTTWTLEVRDKAATPRTWFGPWTVALPSDGKPIIVDLVQSTDPNKRHGLFMEGGIDVITAAGAPPGELAISVEYGIPGL